MNNIPNTLFDNWAKSYERTIAKHQDTYPFAGYFDVINHLRGEIQAYYSTPSILDIGVGTGYMLNKISEGLTADYFGVDFSSEMLNIAASKLDGNRLLYWDISNETIPLPIANRKFDFIISAYTLHHFDTIEKLKIIRNYKKLLNTSGQMMIVDISFDSIFEREQIKAKAGKNWDSSEEKGYFIAPEFLNQVQQLDWRITYLRVSFCLGVFIVG